MEAIHSLSISLSALFCNSASNFLNLMSYDVLPPRMAPASTSRYDGNCRVGNLSRRRHREKTDAGDENTGSEAGDDHYALPSCQFYEIHL